MHKIKSLAMKYNIKIISAGNVFLHLKEKNIDNYAG